VSRHKIDWAKIQSAHDFEELATTLIFLDDLLSVNLIKQIARNDLYWTTWHSENQPDYVYRVIYDSPLQNADRRDKSLQGKFDEKVATVWRHGKPNTKVFLFLNFDDPPPDWAKNREHLKIITAAEIAATIEEKNWWPIFLKYFEGGMHINDAKECEFLKAFTESLVPAVDELSIKETINVISWIEEIAFYRPKEVLAFSQALYESEKSQQDDKHPVFGSITLTRNLSQPVEEITGYYYGRDFLVKGYRTYYKPDFNQKTLDVIERMLKEEKNSALLIQCLAVIPNLLKMKVDTSEWSGDKRAVTWREYRLPLTDEELQNVRKRALRLLFTAFNESGDKELRHRCLVELKDAFHHLSVAEELQEEFQELLGFLSAHANDEDPFVLNWILEMLEPFSRTGLEAIRTEATSLQTQLQEKFELQLYHLLFGKMGWDPSSDEVRQAVKQSYDRWSDDPRHLLLLIDGFHKTADSYPTGLRAFFRALGYEKTGFAAKMVMIVSDDPTFRSDLSPLLIQSLGYILCGVRLKDEAQWRDCIDALRTEPDNITKTIVLTGLHIHDFDKFTADDLKIIEDMIADADEEIRILAAETLWYFDKYHDFTAVLTVYGKLAEHITEELAASVLKGLTHGLQEEGLAKRWADEGRRDILKKILFSLVDFPRLDWDSMAGYCLELLLRVLWKYSTDDLLEFFQLRLDPERVKREGYDPLPYDLNTLFQRVSDEKQNEFVSRVLDWDIERYGIYWIARLIGLACNKNVQPATVTTLRETISKPQKNQLLLITKLLDQIPLGETFYDLAMRIVKKGYGRREVRSQLYSSFISTTGGSRSLGEPFPSHLHHKTLIDKFRTLNKRSKKAQKFLDLWETEIDDRMRRDEQEDLER
jgi:hypothetical protein